MFLSVQKPALMCKTHGHVRPQTMISSAVERAVVFEQSHIKPFVEFWMRQAAIPV